MPPFLTEVGKLEREIIDAVEANLQKLTDTYVPSAADNQLFFPYGNKFVLLSMGTYNHSTFFFEIGRDLIGKVKEHETRIGRDICKEGLCSIIAVAAMQKNDLLNYRIWLERVIEQRELYGIAAASLIHLIDTENIFGSIKREANRVFDVNVVINTYQRTHYPNLTFTNTCAILSAFHQHQFINHVLTYRLLHFSLPKPNCPKVVFEQCYSLIQNLCALIESSLKEKKASTKLFWNLLSQDINDPYKNILVNVLNLKNTYPTNDIATFNINLPLILPAMEAATNPDEIVVYALYIAYMCRNQVLHNVDDTILFHEDGEKTEKVIGILICAVFFTSLV